MPAQKLDKQHSLKILNMEPTGISTNSHQQLMSDCDSSDVMRVTIDRGTHLRDISKMKWFTVIILCYVNLINYMDRFTLAGVLTEVQVYFGIGQAYGGLLQTAFVISYMLFAPLFGYLGDRYNRRYIMAFGVFLWSVTTLVGSFMETFTGFIIFRAMVGVGEASYSTIAPTIISDLFIKDVRSKMLALFYFAIPVGSGLGYIVGSETARAVGSWHWALRVTPSLGALAVVLIIFVMLDPKRGEDEMEGNQQFEPTSWWTDIKELSKNASFVLSTAGFTCVAFVAGALAWWGPTFIAYGIALQTKNEDLPTSDLTFVFGVITMLAGIVGLSLGTFLSSSLKRKFPKADPVICAVGLFISAPILIGCTFVVMENTVLCYVLLFFGQVALNLNWAIVADILLYVVIPTRRSTAEAFQILISHALGDAGSPYLIGVISEALIASFSSARGVSNTIPDLDSVSTFNATNKLIEMEDKYISLQYALFTTAFVEVLGGFFFLCTALYVLRDKMLVDQAISGDSSQPKNLYADDPLTEIDQRRNLVS